MLTQSANNPSTSSLWNPPSQCLAGANLFFYGFSEVGRYFTWLNNATYCHSMPSNMCLDMRPKTAINQCPKDQLSISSLGNRCHSPGAHKFWAEEARRILNVKKKKDHVEDTLQLIDLRDGLCREHNHGKVGGLNMTCLRSGTRFNMSYRWKTFQRDAFDVEDRTKIVAAAAADRSRPVFVILEGGGPHHFAQFKDHAMTRQPESVFTTVSDDWSWPQAWTNHYINATKALMRLHSGYPPNVCVLWKAMHVGPRSRNDLGYHHPSVVNGPHHMLNRLAISAAQDAGVPVIDLTELTITRQPFPKDDGAHRSVTPDGDPYHGYPLSVLGPELVSQMCAKCSRTNRVP